jgi:hypothetical protein
MSKHNNAVSITDIQKAYALSKQISIIDNKIYSRISYIADIMGSVFELTHTSWEFGYEGNDTSIWDTDNYTEERINVKIEGYVKANRLGGYPDGLPIIDKNGKRWELSDGIPTRWLYEDFEEELAQGKVMIEQQEQQRRDEVTSKKKNDEQARQKLIDQAKAKLSKEEFAAINKILND